MSKPPETLLEFPCCFPLKIIGARHDNFAQTVLDIIRLYAPDLVESDIEMRASSHAKYIALTVTITATSKEQLDNLYRALSSHEMVKYLL